MNPNQTHETSRRSPNAFATLLLSLACLCQVAQSAEPVKNAPEAAGVWKWTQRPRNNNNAPPFEMSLKLKQDGEKLSGVQLGRGGEVPVLEGRLHEGKVSFKVVPEFGGGSFIIKYEGVLKGDTIEGKIETNRGGEISTNDWIAKREAPKEKKAINISGTWQWTFTTSAGQAFEPRVQLIQTGDKLTGHVIWGETQAPISDGSIEEEQVSFTVVRDRGGRAVKTKYRGKLAGDFIQGKMESDWSGDVQTFDWTAQRAGARP